MKGCELNEKIPILALGFDFNNSAISSILILKRYH